LIGPIQYLKVKNQSAKNNNDGNTVLLMINWIKVIQLWDYSVELMDKVEIAEKKMLSNLRSLGSPRW
jgi:hypothetical protein